MRGRDPQDSPGALPIAVAREHGDTLEIEADENGVIHLIFRRAETAERLAESQCPTFQVDGTSPLLHPPLGSGCRVAAGTAVVDLARQAARHVDSKFLYALVNGNRLAVRYLARDRRYVEAVFSLRHAKRAVKRAVGGRRIRPR